MFRFILILLSALSAPTVLSQTPLVIPSTDKSPTHNVDVTSIDLSAKHNAASQQLHHDVSIASVDIQLAADYDHDGYFSRVDVKFDADSYYDQHWLYAELVLSDGITDYHYHTTDDFVIYGHASYDEFGVETTLNTGFSPSYYEVTILLYDAFSHELLTVVNTANHYNVESLALESLDYDTRRPVNYPPNRPSVHSHEYGGSLSMAFGLFLVFLFFVKRKQKALF